MYVSPASSTPALRESWRSAVLVTLLAANETCSGDNANEVKGSACPEIELQETTTASATWPYCSDPLSRSVLLGSYLEVAEEGMFKKGSGWLTVVIRVLALDTSPVSVLATTKV